MGRRDWLVKHLTAEIFKVDSINMVDKLVVFQFMSTTHWNLHLPVRKEKRDMMGNFLFPNIEFCPN